MTNFKRRGRWRLRPLLLAASCSAIATPALATTTVEQDLTRLSLEDLANVQITSVSRRPEAVGDAAAAVYVIDAQAIRRSGATSLPEVLRLAPNLQVQRVNTADYAISARGFNGFETSNKLLVLIDGRTVYSTLHSGVFWDIRTPSLEDIERIEVISGPGGALYGANAVNGVINIITSRTRDTLGGLVNVGGGNEDRTLTARYGWRMGTAGAARAYLYAFDRDESFRQNGDDATDETSGLRGGVRGDWVFDRDTVTIQGELFRNRMRVNEDFSGDATRADGGSLLTRFTRTFDQAGELQLQVYYDHMKLTEPATTETNDTWDIHLQHALDAGDRHELVWGGGYRRIRTELESRGGGAFLEPAMRKITLANLFVQDQMALTDALTLTVGVKYETNSLSGDEVLPSARLAWRKANGALVWGAVSRAARTPSRIESDLRSPGFLEPADFRSEVLTAYELGYRANPTPNTAISVSAFYNDYDHLRSLSFTPDTVLPFFFANEVQGQTWGLETWGSWDVRPSWRLSAGLITLEKDFEVEAGKVDIAGLASAGDDPGYQFIVKSQADLTDNIELDVRLRAVDELDASGVDAYVEADARVGWHVNDSVELAVTGQNLLDDRRVETADPARRRYFGRSVYANLRWSF